MAKPVTGGKATAADHQDLLLKRHLSYTTSALTFLLLSHSQHLPGWLRVGCGVIVVALLAWMHQQMRKLARA